MKVAVLKIQDKIEDQVFVELLKKIGQDKQDRIKRFLHYQDRQRSLFADLLVRKVLLETKGLRTTDINFSALPLGKPVLLNNPEIHFNTSHSGDWIACILDVNEVGIDVEQIDTIDLSLSDSFFCEDEHNNIIKNEYPNQKFFEYWTLKESYIKFIGTGLSQPLNSFSIKFFGDNKIRVETDGSILPNVYFKQYEIESGYKVAACATHDNFPANCIVYTYEEVINSIMNDQ